MSRTILLVASFLGLLAAACAPAAPSPTAPPKPTAAPAKPTEAPKPAPTAAPAAKPAEKPAEAKPPAKPTDAPAAKPAAKPDVKTSRPASMTRITVLFPQSSAQPDWPHLWVAQHLGYFKEENLDVDIQFTSGSGDSARLTGVGRGDIGLGGSDAVLIAVAGGAPLTSVYTHQQGSIFGVGVLADGPIKEVKDLKGKTIGVASFGSGALAIAKAMMKEAGLDPEKDATFIEIGVGAGAASALSSGRVDATAHWDTMWYQFERQGLKLRVFESPKFDEFFGSTVNVREESLQKSPEVIEAFLRAFNKGIVFSLENPTAAIEAMGKLVPEVLKDKEQSIGIMQVRARKTWGLPPQAGGVLGWNSVERWKKYHDFLLETGQLKQPVDVAKVWDDRFLRAAMAFDQAAIKQQARNWKP